MNRGNIGYVIAMLCGPFTFFCADVATAVSANLWLAAGFLCGYFWNKNK